MTLMFTQKITFNKIQEKYIKFFRPKRERSHKRIRRETIRVTWLTGGVHAHPLWCEVGPRDSPSRHLLPPFDLRSISSVYSKALKETFISYFRDMEPLSPWFIYKRANPEVNLGPRLDALYPFCYEIDVAMTLLCIMLVTRLWVLWF